MKNAKNIFWGLALILIAVLIVLTQIEVINIFAGFSFWNILLLALLAIILVDGIIKLDFFMIFVPLAFAYNIVQGVGLLPDTLPVINIWSLLLIALLLSIGCSMIFGGMRKKGFRISVNNRSGKNGKSTSYSQSGEDGIVNIDSNFGNVTRYLDVPDFRELNADNNFGQLNVYLSNVTLASAQCKINLDNNFGSINLYVPKEWQIELNPDSSFGHVEFHKTTDAPAGAPIAYINADSSFGSIEIYQM